LRGDFDLCWIGRPRMKKLASRFQLGNSNRQTPWSRRPGAPSVGCTAFVLISA
jgi:hypothetical protein